MIGLDLGGTTLRGAVVDTGNTNTVIAEARREFDAEDPIEGIAGFARSLAAEAGMPWTSVAALGIGVAGSLHDGAVSLATNIPSLAALRLGDELERVLERPVVVDNDVNMAALGEWTALGADQDQCLVFLSVGTGVGVGVIANGGLVRGAHGEAGEVGFLPLSINGDLTVEDLAGGAALARRLRAVAPTETPHTGREILDLADAGHALAQSLADDQGDAVAAALLAIRYVLDPHLVVVGGGVGLRSGFVEDLWHRAQRQADLAPGLVQPSLLADRAGTLGAAQAAKRALAGRPQLLERRSADDRG